MRPLTPDGRNGSSGEDAGTRVRVMGRPRPARLRLPRDRAVGGATPSVGAAREPFGAELVFARYLAILRAQWIVIVAAVIVVTGGVAIGSAMKEPVYRATGTIEIRKQAGEVVPVEAIFQFERISDQYLQTQYEMLRSPALVRRMLRDTALLARAEASEGAGRGVGDLRTRIEAMADRIRAGLSVSPIVGSRMVRVSIEARDPVVASTVVNALIAQYIAMRGEAGVAALRRLAEQADSVRAQVLQAEAHLQQFVRENRLGAIVGTGGGAENVPQERLRRLEQELTLAEAEGYRAEAQHDASQEQAAAIDSDLLKTLRERIAQLQAEYARLRSAFTDSFPRARQLRTELAQLDSLVASEQQRVTSAMSSQHYATQRRRELLQRAVSEQRMLMDNLATKNGEYERLKRDLEGQKQLYVVLQQRRKESTVAAALAAADVAVIEPAAPPQSPARPLPGRDIPLGALVGLMLGIGAAFLRAQTDVTVKTLDEVEELSDAPVLGLIPSVRVVRSAESRASPTALAVGGKRYSVDLLAEAFRGLRTSVLFESTGQVPRTLLITSPAPGDGKTFVATNLAISLVALGRRVLLIDADFRRPSVHRAFRLSSTVGLPQHLAGLVLWQEAVSRDVMPGLDVLAARTSVRDSSDLLSSAAVRTLLSEARFAYDFVVVDAPALFINLPDARILAQLVEGVILVVRSGATPRDVARRLLGQTPNLFGVVLNGYDVRQLPASYAAYGETTVTS